MRNEFDWKKFEFITTVQTALINNATNRALDENAIANRAEFSATTTLYEMSETFRAADMIPDDVSAREAAHQFGHWLISRAGKYDPGATMPSWFGPPITD